MATGNARPAEAVRWREEAVEVCGGRVRYELAGNGPTLLVLPRDNGHAPRNDLLDALAATNTVYYPWLPGFHGGEPEAWDWLTNVRDLAVVMRQFVAALGIERLSLLGLGFGGWLAAEMASMGNNALDRIVLIAPMGAKPKSAFIFDQFIVSTEHYAQTAFEDPATYRELYGEETALEQLEAWETDREMTSRLAWKPYMYNPALPKLLAGVPTSTLILWGENDGVVPLECGEIYQSSLPDARLEQIAGAGHALDLERPAALASIIAPFLSAR